MIAQAPRWSFAIAFVLILLLGAAFRLADLSAKPMHGDEANQAVKAARLLETGKYAYDPFEHHGPTLYYFTQPVFWLSSTRTLVASQEWQYRLVPGMFGILTIALLWFLRDALGRAGTLWAALLTAVSHAMVYYSRYYIQEPLFTCFALGAIAAGWAYVKRPSIPRAILLGLALGLIHATKETSILIFAGYAVSLATVIIWHRIESRSWPNIRAQLATKNAAACIITALIVSVAFYSSFGTHPRGVLDSILTYTRYFSRAEGTGSVALHDKPFLYYLETLFFTYREPGPWWTEGFALLMAPLGITVAIFSRRSAAASEASDPAIAPRHFLRFLAVYGVFLTLIFSAVPYKTPWNLLPFWQPLLMLAGVGVGWLTTSLGNARVRAVLCLACSAAVAHAGHQAYQGAFVYPADTRNPYVYAHTSTAISRILERTAQIAAIHPQGIGLVIAVVGDGGDYWPLPWYLRAYPNVGYWTKSPGKLDADIVIASARFGPELQDRLGAAYHVETGALRPSAILAVFVKNEWWDKFMAGRQ